MIRGQGFLDRMIALVEGAKRQKTPNEIALTLLLAALTLIFLLVCVSRKAFGVYSGAQFSLPVLIALLVGLIPTAIGGLLRLLVVHAGKVLTHQQLLTEVRGPGAVQQTHYLRVHLAHLREKIETDPARPELITTEPAVGYRLVAGD